MKSPAWKPVMVLAAEFTVDRFPCKCAPAHYNVAVLLAGTLGVDRLQSTLFVHCRVCGATEGNVIGKKVRPRVVLWRGR